jgi:hypothetical protein
MQQSYYFCCWSTLIKGQKSFYITQPMQWGKKHAKQELLCLPAHYQYHIELKTG